MKQKNNHGFTLVELMIVVAILGVITAVAIPAYDEYLRKSRRVEARVALAGIAQLQETYYTKRNTYTTKLTGADSVNCDQKGLCKVDGSNVLSSDGNYLLSVDSANNVGYTLSATIFGSKQAKDATKCNKFTLNEKNQKTSTPYPASDCW